MSICGPHYSVIIAENTEGIKVTCFDKCLLPNGLVGARLKNLLVETDNDQISLFVSLLAIEMMRLVFLNCQWDGKSELAMA